MICVMAYLLDSLTSFCCFCLCHDDCSDDSEPYSGQGGQQHQHNERCVPYGLSGTHMAVINEPGWPKNWDDESTTSTTST